ncbi:Enoyl reductase [Penicillium hetheringtonii]|uniref:Enoyl reductase n=1 Tax=Penicillium hetheringtonii TaxID=911720 RepID=A0AAD6E1H7_9EURO|nr:Enoyl reductase [Penicillium hetheringtonii]
MAGTDVLRLQRAIVQHKDGILRITPDLPIQQPSSRQLLVRVLSVALNPCDFKMPLRYPTPGLWNGCDFAGTVVAIGSEAAKEGRFSVGDEVFGAVQGSNQADPTSGAYCEYLTVDQDFVFHIPKNLSFTSVSGISGTAIATLGIALFWSLRISGALDAPSSTQEDVFVYGGSSTLGMLAIQMVKLCGHRVITTCSPRNFELVRSYGADLVFDYHSTTCAKDIRAATKNTLRYVLDPFSDVRSVTICQEAFGRTGGRYCGLEQYQEQLFTRKTVKHELIMGGAISGNGVKLPDPYGVLPNPEIGLWARNWYRAVQRLIGEGKIKPSPVEILSGGLDAVIPGLDRLKNGNVSGKKLAVPLLLGDSLSS